MLRGGRCCPVRHSRPASQRYSPVSRMWAHPSGEMWASSSGATGFPARSRCRTASPRPGHGAGGSAASLASGPEVRPPRPEGAPGRRRRQELPLDRPRPRHRRRHREAAPRGVVGVGFRRLPDSTPLREIHADPRVDRRGRAAGRFGNPGGGHPSPITLDVTHTGVYARRRLSKESNGR